MLARLNSGPLRALSHPAYAKVWSGAFVSNVGTWMETIAVGVYVTQTTGKAGWTGTVAALAFLPSVIVGPIVGLLVLLTGIASTLGGPAYHAFLADLVPEEDLLSAMTLSSAQFNLARIVGPSLAAIAIAAAGFGAAFAAR
ncbi:MAG: MFS transporter [Myxococcaceae bacterium]